MNSGRNRKEGREKKKGKADRNVGKEEIGGHIKDKE